MARVAARADAGAGQFGASFIDIRDVTLTYVGSDGTPVHALSPISTRVSENEFVSIIGPSGCGKTTLLKVLGDLLQPSAGEVRIAGRHPGDLRRTQAIGHMFQDSVLLPWKTIGDNIRLLSDIARRPLAHDEVVGLSRMVGIEGFLNRYPHELSGGMRQRAAICRALALDPALLLMDEPFAALDEITREKMNQELLRVWQERKKTVVFVTHSIGEAVFLSDRVLVMSARPGRIIADVKIELPRPRTREVRYSDELNHYVHALHAQLMQAEPEDES